MTLSRAGNKSIKLDVAQTPLHNSALLPQHYKAGDNDVIAFCQEHELSFNRGNVVKYVTRAGKKIGSDELEDLNKALVYLTREIAYIENKRKF